MEFLLFLMVIFLVMSVVYIEKESVERDKKLKKKIKKLSKKMDNLALCVFCLLKESDIYAELQKSEQIGRKK